ncbi:MAG TPA: hypothetical protein VGX48_06020 [Pyrinomonadaceae bacterium]|jgi:hypothetical protein|nr:hypothetical protein [Pyrinomonadaceae bacterium]
MVNHRAGVARVVVGGAGAVCIACVFAALTARAQQGTLPGPPAPGNRDPVAEARERQQREAQLRGLEMLGGPKKEDRRGAEAAAEQMKDDFKHIQILRNKVVRHLRSEQALDYRFIAAEAGEINKRAGRLRSHLVRAAAAEGEKKEPVEIGEAQMKDALATMCKRIDSFTENPIFKEPSVVDVEQSAKADRDLRHILLLSAGIRKTAERLGDERKK